MSNGDHDERKSIDLESKFPDPRNPYCIREVRLNDPKYTFSYVILRNCTLLNNFTVDRTSPILPSGANCARQMDRIAEIQI